MSNILRGRASQQQLNQQGRTSSRSPSPGTALQQAQQWYAASVPAGLTVDYDRRDTVKQALIRSGKAAYGDANPYGGAVALLDQLMLGATKTRVGYTDEQMRKLHECLDFVNACNRIRDHELQFPRPQAQAAAMGPPPLPPHAVAARAAPTPQQQQQWTERNRQWAQQQFGRSAQN